MRADVVDISSYQAVHDWPAVKNAGIVAVIHKATEGQSLNEKALYSSREQSARAAGLLWGAYHFGTSAPVEHQVDNFLLVVDLSRPTLLCLDWEAYPKSQMTAQQASDFVRLVTQRTGQQVVLYTGSIAKDVHVANPILLACPLWLAQYSERWSAPAGWRGPWLWQYTGDSEGPTPHTIDGITANNAGNAGLDLSTYCIPRFSSPGTLADDWARLATGIPAPMPAGHPVPFPTLPPNGPPIAPGNWTPLPSRPLTPVPVPQTGPMPAAPVQPHVLAQGSRTWTTLRIKLGLWLGAVGAYLGISDPEATLHLFRAENIKSIGDSLHAAHDVAASNAGILVACVAGIEACTTLAAAYFCWRIFAERRYTPRVGTQGFAGPSDGSFGDPNITVDDFGNPV